MLAPSAVTTRYRETRAAADRRMTPAHRPAASRVREVTRVRAARAPQGAAARADPARGARFRVVERRTAGPARAALLRAARRQAAPRAEAGAGREPAAPLPEASMPGQERE